MRSSPRCLVLPVLLAIGPLQAQVAFDAGEDGTTFPELINRVSPRFPTAARTQHISGNVILGAVVRRDGSVGDIKVIRADAPGHGFEQAAAEALGLWRYKPGTRDGEPVDVVFMVIVEFQLRGSGVRSASFPVDLEFESNLWKAQMKRQEGDLDEALEHAQAGLRQAESFSRRDPRVPYALDVAADVQLERGENVEAQLLLQRSIENRKKALGKTSLEPLEAMGKLCALHFSQERYSDAEQVVLDAIRLLEKHEQHAGALAWWLERHRRILMATNRPEEAAGVARRALSLQDRDQP